MTTNAVRRLSVVVVLLVLVAACDGDDETTPTGSAAATTAPATTSTTAPGTTATTATPSTTATTSTTTTSGLPPVSSLESGLFCRDLAALGYGYAAAVDYWTLEGRPNRMDADRNGIPCETVYPADAVAAYWGTGSVATLADAPLITTGSWPGPAWPTSLGSVAYREDVPDRLYERLLRDGFAIDGESFAAHLAWLYESVYPYGGRPVFVTTDAAYHHWHLVFDKILRDTEAEQLLPVLEDFVTDSLTAARAQTTEFAGSVAADAALRVEEHLEAVATVLGLEVGPIGTRAREEVALVMEHVAFGASPTAGGDCSADPASCVDYSLMTPRGHYTRSEELTRFFRGMSLLGNVGFSLDDPATLRVGLLLARLVTTDPALTADWETVYYPTAVLVGAADDYTPFEAAVAAAAAVTGGLDDPARLTDAALRDVAAELRATRPVQINPERASLRTMGVRFVLDSWIYDGLVFPAVPNRTMISPLDFAAAMGSDWARARLAEADPETTSPDYEQAFGDLREAVASRTLRDWGATIYDAWLYSLEPTMVPHGAAYPPFMRTEAWTAKSLQTALASYTELKHDTILYAKQGIAEGDLPPPPTLRHWVEPDPVTFRRIANTATLLRDVLTEMEVLPAGGDELSHRALLEDFIGIATRLADLAEKELRGEPLTAEENGFAGEIGGHLGWILERSGDDFTLDPFGGLVADIFLDAVEDEVREVGTGDFEVIYVIVPDGSGGFQVAQGGVSSYYEFLQPRAERLTDELWWERLEQRALPDRPPWVTAYLGL